MNIWRCMVCGHEHTGDHPPAKCPVCGVGREEFTLKNNHGDDGARGVKRWKCTVCDYIHTGDQPPDKCPLCGVGPDAFVLLEEKAAALNTQVIADTDMGTIRAALNMVSYGLYVVAAAKDGKYNGMCANTVFQLTDKPPQIAVCINKNNLTHEYIEYSGTFTVSILGREQLEAVRRFGYRSGRSMDKFAEVDFLPGLNGCPILRNCIAYLEATVIPAKTTDVGTHTLFVAVVTSGRMALNEEGLTYAYYRQNKK